MAMQHFLNLRDRFVTGGEEGIPQGLKPRVSCSI
jgi:hypothetical protein